MIQPIVHNLLSTPISSDKNCGQWTVDRRLKYDNNNRQTAPRKDRRKHL